MPISLKEILEKKEQIISIAFKMGLINLHFVKKDRDVFLHLKADLNPDDKCAWMSNVGILETYLSNQLGCNILIDVEQKEYQCLFSSCDKSKSTRNRGEREYIVPLSEMDEKVAFELYDRPPEQVHFYARRIKEEKKALVAHDLAQTLRAANRIMKKWDERQAQSVVSSAESDYSARVLSKPSADVNASASDPEIKEQMQQTIQKLLASQNKPVPSSMWSSPKISQKRKKDILEAVIEALDESEQGGESSGTEYWLVTVLDTQKDRLSKKRRIKETL